MVGLACYINLCIIVGYGVMCCIYNRYILSHISDSGVWRETPLEVVCNNHSPTPIYGGYLPWTGV